MRKGGPLISSSRSGSRSSWGSPSAPGRPTSKLVGLVEDVLSHVPNALRCGSSLSSSPRGWTKGSTRRGARLLSAPPVSRWNATRSSASPLTPLRGKTVGEIGRASCRERGERSAGGGDVKKEEGDG